MMHDRDRIPQFDGIRALAFMMVFIHHGLHVPLLWMGVDQFFVLSGFLITRNLLAMRESTVGSALATFYFRRVLRIVPAYYLALGLIMLTQRVANADVPWFFGFASNVHDAIYGPSGGALNPMWSIAVEEQFYVIWPLLVLFLPRRWLTGMFVLAILTAPIARFLFTPYGYDAVYRLTPSRMDLLAAGALLARLDALNSAWFTRFGRRFLAIGVLAAGLFAALSIHDPHFRTSLDEPLFNVVGFALSALVFTAVLAFVRGCNDGPVYRVLVHPVPRYLGEISYMAYLVHMLALGLAARAHAGMVPTAMLGLVVTIGIASASWYALERPLRRMRRLVKLQPKVS